MKVVLVNGRFEGGYADPLGIGYVGAVLRERGVDVTLIDPVIGAVSPSRCAEQVAALRPDVVGVSILMLGTRPDVIEFVRALRPLCPGTHVALGGRDASMSYADYLARAPADSVVIGEGEAIFVELVEALAAGRDWREQKGIALREGGELRLRPGGPRIDDPDAIPVPLRDTLRSYKAHNPDDDVAQILGSRGCYALCTFCSSPRFDRLHGGKRVRLRSTEKVVAEMRALADEFGVRHFDFVDDVFLLPGRNGLERARELRELLAGDPRGLTFNAQMRVDAMQRQALEDLRDAGLVSLFVGIENWSEEALSTFRKGSDAEDCERGLGEALKAGFDTRLDAEHRLRIGMITFHADSTVDSLRVQVAAARRWKLAPKRLATEVLPLDGTALHEAYDERRILTGEGHRHGFDYQDESVRRLVQHWKPFIAPLTAKRDRIRSLEKRALGREAPPELAELVRARTALDEVGYDVFERMCDLAEGGRGDGAFEALRSDAQARFESFWSQRVLARLEHAERAFGPPPAPPSTPRVTNST